MAEDRDALQTRIQSLITAGNLPCEDCVVTWYGDGRGRRCAACDRDILGADTEIECDVPGGGTIFFHLACYDAWQSVLAAKE
jgi:hypothetical protein